MYIPMTEQNHAKVGTKIKRKDANIKEILSKHFPKETIKRRELWN